jgi:hypothetical protein
MVLEFFLLMLAGAFAAFLHYKLRIPLNIPGHHGLEFMAIFVVLRMGSNFKYAATIATLGTGIMLFLPGMGAVNPMTSLGYLLPGIMLDLFYIFNKADRKQSFFFIALIAGISYMSIPLSRFIVYFFADYPYMAFIKFGVTYTILSFFFFGLLGGILGFGLNSVKPSFNKNQKTNIK